MPKFFSGFALKGEELFLKEYLRGGEFVVAGFSYGAILALEYVLSCGHRVDYLQLFSPAFFKDKSDEFKRTQLFYYTKNPQKYVESFLKNVTESVALENCLGEHTKEALERLLSFEWEKPLHEAHSKNIKIEIYLGENDKIIDADTAMEFFRRFGEVYYIKRADHLLQVEEKR